MLDANWLDAWPQPNETIVSNLNLSLGAHAPGLNRLLLDRHHHYSGVAFMDGHVNKYKLEDLWLLSWHNWWEKPGPVQLQKIRDLLPP
jgi:hypothetical protein